MLPHYLLKQFLQAENSKGHSHCSAKIVIIYQKQEIFLYFFLTK